MEYVEIEVTEDVFKEVDINIANRIIRLENAIDYLGSHSHSSNVNQKASEILYKALDSIADDECDRVINSILDDCDKEIIKASKYCGYTNVQYGTMEVIYNILRDN